MAINVLQLLISSRFFIQHSMKHAYPGNQWH